MSAHLLCLDVSAHDLEYKEDKGKEGQRQRLSPGERSD